MISKIHSTTIAVNDEDEALDFYVTTLGWEKAADVMVGEGMRWLTVVPPDAATELALADASWAAGENGPAKVGGHTGVTLASPDIDATYETLSARGVAFKAPVVAMPWGSKATWFTDPNGNEFFLTEG